MRQILILIGLLWGVSATAPAFADGGFKCDTGAGAQCHCAGADNCKQLEKSQMCGNNSLNCSNSSLPGVGYTCDCKATLKPAGSKLIDQAKPKGKSQ